MTASELEATPDKDWDARALCPDESCIGVLGQGAICSVCGQRGTLPPPGTLPSPGERLFATADDLHDTAPERASDADAADDDDGELGDLADTAADGEFADRELCPDESCIGVLGPEGTCKVCGAKKHDQNAPRLL